jgi:hypothetical protein
MYEWNRVGFNLYRKELGIFLVVKKGKVKEFFFGKGKMQSRRKNAENILAPSYFCFYLLLG